MLIMHNHSSVGILGRFVLLIGVFSATCTPPSPIDATRQKPDPDPSPIAVEIGQEKIRLDELQTLSEIMADLHQEFEIPSVKVQNLEDRVDLATELVALAHLGVNTASVELSNAKKRLMVRIFLKRTLSEIEQHKITEEQFQQALDQEINTYHYTGQSMIYRPTRVDVTYFGIGYFPDFSDPDLHSVTPLLDREQILALAETVRLQTGDRVLDLDDFLAIGRRFLKNNPTLRIVEVPSTTIDPRYSSLPEIVLEGIKALRSNGDISPVIELETGALILRRGTTYPGKGESVEQARDALTDLLTIQRKRTCLGSNHRIVAQAF